MIKLRDSISRRSGSDNYRDIESAVARRADFAGSGMHGKRLIDGTYVVGSYDTIIAIARPDGEVEITDNSWGPTTGRHINICKRGL